MLLWGVKLCLERFDWLQMLRRNMLLKLSSARTYQRTKPQFPLSFTVVAVAQTATLRVNEYDPLLRYVRQLQHRSQHGHTHFGRLDRVVLVVHGGGRAGHVVNVVHFGSERLGDVMPHELEIWLVEEVL